MFLPQKLAKLQVQRNATGSSNLISKTAISKMLLGTKSYLHYKLVHRCLCLHYKTNFLLGTKHI